MSRRGATGSRIASISIFLLALAPIHGEFVSGSLGLEHPLGRSVESRTRNVTPMHKALMTQRGYIQFLRWELPVPEIEEFTFCLWVKSTNLTHRHSIFSYSKREKDRLVSAWISAFGASIRLEIDGVEVFVHPTNLMEHRWYHICQSWDNNDGRHALWLDGLKVVDNCAKEMAGHVVPSEGDIVVGQEYTDFDKGLEEGIEGAVLAFNFILASAFDATEDEYLDRNKFQESHGNGFDGQFDFDVDETGARARAYDSRDYPRIAHQHPVFRNIPFAILDYPERSSVHRKSLDLVPRILGVRNNAKRESRTKRKSYVASDRGTKNSNAKGIGEKPLGQRLVDISFAHCKEGRGSPRIGGKLMLVSWTRTPVRVFGGAIIKNVDGDCGRF